MPATPKSLSLEATVLHVIEPSSAGGAESVVLGLARETVRRGGRVVVGCISQSEGNGEFAQALRALGVEVAEILCGRRRYRAEARRIASLIESCGADIVHTHVYHADLVGYWAARKMRRPIVATVHGFTAGGWKHAFYQWLDVRALRYFDAVLCVSRGVCERLVASGCDARRVHLVPNGYGGGEVLPRAEARRVLGLAERDRVVGWVGRLSHEKGPDLFVDSFIGGVVDPDAMAVMIGDGVELARLKQIAASTRRLRLAGAIPAADRLLAAFDVLVISSRTEGLPMILLEGMAARVPIVAFGVGGIPEVLDSNAAWLVPPGDLTGLAAAIRQVLADPAAAAARSSRAYDTVVSEYGVGRWLDKIQAVYAQVLDLSGASWATRLREEQRTEGE